MLRAAPGAFPHIVQSPDGGDWIAGGREWRINPRFAIPQSVFHVVRLWSRCQGGMGGFAQLPEAGGLNDQPSWLVEAFSTLSNWEAETRKPN